MHIVDNAMKMYCESCDSLSFSIIFIDKITERKYKNNCAYFTNKLVWNMPRIDAKNNGYPGDLRVAG